MAKRTKFDETLDELASELGSAAAMEDGCFGAVIFIVIAILAVALMLVRGFVGLFRKKK